MKTIFTYTPEHLVQTEEFWTGHIDSYFNKRFELKSIVTPATFSVTKCSSELQQAILFSTTSQFAEGLNDVHFIMDMTRKYKLCNLLTEFADDNNCRNHLSLLAQRFKVYEGESDDAIYQTLQLEVDAHNKQQKEEMYQFLTSINAVADFEQYHKGRIEMYQHLNQVLTQLIQD